MSVQPQGSAHTRSHKNQQLSPPERDNESNRYGAGQTSHQYSGLRPIDNDSFSEEDGDQHEEESMEYEAIQLNQMAHDEDEDDDY